MIVKILHSFPYFCPSTSLSTLKSFQLHQVIVWHYRLLNTPDLHAAGRSSLYLDLCTEWLGNLPRVMVGSGMDPLSRSDVQHGRANLVLLDSSPTREGPHWGIATWPELPKPLFYIPCEPNQAFFSQLPSFLYSGR